MLKPSILPFPYITKQRQTALKGMWRIMKACSGIRTQGQLTNDFDEIRQDHPIPKILSQVLHRLHCWPLLELCIHPGHISLQLLLEKSKK